jgi:methylated-DNA-[protein]-cysteine S-methyltransferase
VAKETTAQGYALFDTAIGCCGLVWGESGVLALQLPEAAERGARVRLLAAFPDAPEVAPPPEARAAIDQVTALLRGEPADLSGIRLDMTSASPFYRKVYEAARAIPPGSTLSYGEIARRIGSPGAARAVGQALGRNPFPLVVPCHRVLAAGGKPGGFSANGGVGTKLRLLAIEGALKDVEARPDPGLIPEILSPPFDPEAAVAHLRAADAGLARAIDAAGSFDLRLKPAASVFAALAEAIVYQQLAGKAAAAIYARFCGLFPRPAGGPTAERLLRASDEQLRGAGLSRPKMLALRDLARKAVDGAIPTLSEIQAMDDEEIVERLTIVRGVGRWTVEMLLIFRLGRPDVLPLDDYAIRKGFAAVFGLADLPARNEVAARGERWKPYRSAASWFLWRALTVEKR